MSDAQTQLNSTCVDALLNFNKLLRPWHRVIWINKNKNNNLVCLLSQYLSKYLSTIRQKKSRGHYSSDSASLKTPVLGPTAG